MHTTRFLLHATVAGLLLALLAAGPASAQSPTYQTKPRSSGGKAARFGGAPVGGKRASAPGMNGAAPPMAGGASIQTTQRGASRPSVGALAPSAPIKGGLAGGAGAGGGRKTWGTNNAGGAQVFSAEQFKSGSVNSGLINAPRRGR